MKLTLDDESGEMTVEQDGLETRLDLYSRPAFELLSNAWVKLGWNLKYTYTFSWLGRPVIQLPDDLIRLQEVVYRLKPDVVIETGVAHGGSLVFFASLLHLIGKGRVIGVEIELRPHNRSEIENHELFGLIELIDGDSVDPEVVEQVADRVPPGASVLVFLDSCHTRDHVLAELESYHRLVTPGSYIVATDGVMREVANVPRGDREWAEQPHGGGGRIRPGAPGVRARTTGVGILGKRTYRACHALAGRVAEAGRLMGSS